jgi:hypothetical protein
MNTFLDGFWIGFGRGIEDGNSRIEMVVFISLLCRHRMGLSDDPFSLPRLEFEMEMNSRWKFIPSA